MQRENERRVAQLFRAEVGRRVELPFASGGIQAGFPSPAQDYIEDTIDINSIVVRNRPATFFARVKGDSMIDDDIAEGDILVIDKSLHPVQGDLVVAVIDGEFTLKYIDLRYGKVFLVPANKDYAPIEVHEDDRFMVWGVVTYTIRKHRMGKK